MSSALDIDSVIERLLAVRGQQSASRTVQLAEGEIRALCAAARWAPWPGCRT
jgi:serine/threonine-protein phosphatase PP1 catalytic subunit